MSTKLTFNKIRARNFRSCGNMWMELEYGASPTTLVVSTDNGAGKSTLTIWALYYALFGKPYKKDTKLPSLVNSVSGKDLMVEVEFTTKGSDWLIRRGRKPDVFDILKDGKRIEDEAALKDYQAYLQSVIGMDEKAFEYIIALNPDKFVPFTQLNTSQRRSFVEQVLDITVISTMNEITKDRVKAVRKESEQLYYEITNHETKIAGHKRTKQILETQLEQRQKETGDELFQLELSAKNMENMFKKLESKEVEELALLDKEADAKYLEVAKLGMRFEDKKQRLEQEAGKYQQMATCPTCQQCVTEEHKQSIADKAKLDIDKLEAPIEKLKAELEALQVRVNSNVEVNNRLAKIREGKMQLNAKLSAILSQIAVIKHRMQDNNDADLIYAEDQALHTLEVEMDVLSYKLQELKKKEDNHTAFLATLKDDAVKAEIVKQYIPVLNQKVNEYLDSMNLYIQMSMD